MIYYELKSGKLFTMFSRSQFQDNVTDVIECYYPHFDMVDTVILQDNI